MIKQILPLLIILSACARFELVPLESSSVKRLGHDSEKVPNFYVVDYKPSRVSRGLASNSSSELTNKQVYFLTLLKQYKAFNKLLDKEVEINACPQFHNELLVYDDLLRDPNHYSLRHNFSQALVSERSLASFPVLALPYKGADIYSVWKQDQKLEVEQSILQAMMDFNQRNFYEINELCERGASDNYYIFENLVQHHVGDEEFHNNEALPILLKLPVFANMLLLDGLKNYQREGVLDKTLLERSRLGWFRNYLYKLRENRNNVGKFSTYRSFDETDETDEMRNLSSTNFFSSMW